MKICIVGGIYAPGGARRNFLKITPETTLETGLREAGHRVTTLSHYDHCDFSAYDVVHVHHLSYGAIRLASDPSNTPFLFTAHDTSRMNGHAQGRVQSIGMRFVLSRADGVVALSTREADYLAENYSLRGARQAVIPNGVDPSLYSFRRLNSAGQGKPWQVLFTGQLIPLKGVDLLLKAIAQLPANIELSLVYQSAPLENDLKALARELGVADRVHFLGKLDPQALAHRYQSSDLLVLPSSTEALPSVITEAMLCGLPFVATAAGGIPEQAAGFGQLLTQRTPDALAAAMRHVFENYESFAAQGELMNLSARERFSVSNMIERHIALYSGMVHSAVSARRHAARFAPMNLVARLAVRRHTLDNEQLQSSEAVTRP